MSVPVFCPTSAAARGRAYLAELGIPLPQMDATSAVGAKRGIIRLLKLAKALKLTEDQALWYGFTTPSTRSAAQIALIRAWAQPRRRS